MDVTLVRFLALNLAPSLTAAARPGLTFVTVQWLVAVLVRFDLAALPASMDWLISVPALLIALVFAALETAARHDPDVSEVLVDLRVDHLLGAFGAFTSALLFASLGLPETEAAALVTETGPASDLLGATAEAATVDRPAPVAFGAVGAGLTLNVGLVWLRAQIVEFLHEFELAKGYAWLETAGLAGVLFLMPFLPLLAAAFIVAFGVVLAIVGLSVRGAREVADRVGRVPCGCGYKVRPEASVCPECGTEREPTKRMDGPLETGPAAAWTFLTSSPA